MKKVQFSISCVILSIVSITYANVIEIHSNITTNQIWTANNTYHVTAGVNVTALLVIEPGTNISFGYNGGLIVNNGGTLISAGTPNNPITYTSDTQEGWGDYYCAIEIQETASPATKIIYNRIGYASIAILTENIQLDTPIQHNGLFYNVCGIVEYGTHHTDIINNLIYYGYNDYYYSFCIYIYMESNQGAADANSIILIENNTCDYQDYGIVVEGTANINNMGHANLINNIVSESDACGICIINGYIAETVSNTGYYGNTTNKFGFTTEFNPVQATVYPFDATGWHLLAGCPFINAGKEYIEETQLIGTTTNVNSTPDSNKIDIGYHYSNWNYSNAGTTTLRTDFDNNLRVDYKDLRFFANYWLFDYNEAYQTLSWDYDNSGKVDMPDLRVVSEYWLSPFDFYDFVDFANQWQKKVDPRYYDSRADLNNDKIVNFKDFVILANEWRKTAQGNPAISVSVIGDANNLKGEVGVNVTGCRPSTRQVYIFMDGQLMEQTDYMVNEGNPGITINTPSYRNGNHSLKAVAIDNNDIIISGVSAVNFNNSVHCLNSGDTYEPNQPLRLLGLSATGNNLKVKLSKWDGTVVWSQQTTGNLDMSIPGSVLAGQIYDISIEQEISGLKLLDLQLSDSNSSHLTSFNSSSSWEAIWDRAIAAKYDPNKSYQFAIILPTAYYTNIFPYYSSADSRKEAVVNIINDCNAMGIKYIILYERQCTWNNFARVLSSPSVFYAYVVSRGATRLGGATAQRTYFKVSDGYVVSNLDTPLGGGWDGRSDVHSMAYLGFGNSNKFKIVWNDTCFNGFSDDMAKSWMDLGGNPVLGKLYISWNSGIRTDRTECFAAWSAFFWGDPEGFGTHGDRTYFEAFTRAQIEVKNGTWVSGKCGNFGDTMTTTFTKTH